MDMNELSKEAQIFSQEFKNESDRGCILLAAAWLEDFLKQILKCYLVPLQTSENINEKDYTRNFYSMINLVYRLGLISEDFRLCLHYIREIRNIPAHKASDFSFDNEKIKPLMEKLKERTGFIQRNLEIREYRFQPEGLRGDFQMEVSWMHFSLRALLNKVRSESLKPMTELELGFTCPEPIEVKIHGKKWSEKE